MSVHGPVVAGSFYPADPAALNAMAANLVAGASAIGAPPCKAVILPHAGYRYSGACAAEAVAAIDPQVKRVVLLGPSHRHRFRGLALPEGTAVATPLGPVPIDVVARELAATDPDIAVVPEAHAAEHCLEVELPLLQNVLSGFTLVPLVVGDVAPQAIVRVIDKLWGGDETLFVISTDLSHFLSAKEAEQVDLATAERIETADPGSLGAREACGHRPLAAFLTVASRRGMRLTRLGLTHSGHVTGDLDRVVGYGAWMAHDPDRACFSPDHRRALLRIAAQTLSSHVAKGKPPSLNLGSFPVPLQTIAASFVTLTRDKRLRGCIGSLVAHQALASDVMSNAVKAGFHDPRFKPLGAGDLSGLGVEVAVLSRPALMSFSDEADLLSQLRAGVDGLILQDGRRRGTLLPKVWESLPTPEQFLRGLKIKAGLGKEHWSDDLKVWRYITESFEAVMQPS